MVYNPPLMATDKQLQDLGEVHLRAEVYVIYKDKLLMHRRSENKKRFPGYLIGPGGHLNEGEDVVVAACREVAEETGIIVPPTSLKLRYVGIHHHSDTHTVWVNWGYIAKPARIRGQLTESEEGTSEWIELEELTRLRPSIFPPSLEYLDYLLSDSSSVMYTNSEWRDNQLVRTLSKTIIPA
jgi:8-oxo-dGTP pyrophosphatase MutT (NUDIX family)